MARWNPAVIVIFYFFPTRVLSKVSAADAFALEAQTFRAVSKCYKIYEPQQFQWNASKRFSAHNNYTSIRVYCRSIIPLTFPPKDLSFIAFCHPTAVCICFNRPPGKSQDCFCPCSLLSSSLFPPASFGEKKSWPKQSLKPCHLTCSLIVLRPTDRLLLAFTVYGISYICF